jgi:type-F conjugative transfer system pilin assembly thiol-disulfide isomerase TrbB
MPSLFGLLLLIMMNGAFANHHVLEDVIQAKEGQVLLKTAPFQQNHRLVFFFSSTCPHCHQFAPVLKKWVDDNQYAVDAFSFDGKSLPEFSNVLTPDNQLLQAAFQNETIRYPALFVVNIQTANLYPVAIGELNFQELHERMQILVPKIIDFERGVA